RALVDVLPLGRIFVDLRALARACVLGGAAVVLPGLRDAVALFLARLRRDRARAAERRRRDAECEDARESGLNGGLVIHRNLLSMVNVAGSAPSRSRPVVAPHPRLLTPAFAIPLKLSGSAPKPSGECERPGEWRCTARPHSSRR